MSLTSKKWDMISTVENLEPFWLDFQKKKNIMKPILFNPLKILFSNFYFYERIKTPFYK